MLQIVGLILPIFTVIAFGRLSVTWKILTPDGLAALNGFAYWLALPALLFSSIMESYTFQVMGVAGIYLACCILIFASAVVIGVVHFPPILGYTGAQNHRPAKVGFWWKDVLFERR